MRKQGYKLLFQGLANKLLSAVLLFSLLTHPFSLITINAQEAENDSPTVNPPTSARNPSKKDIIRNYKADLDALSVFGTDCSQKNRGDSNCDTLINSFDLSIWQVEFASGNGQKRSDFNSDGIINLVDYGIWRNTFYPDSRVQTNQPKFLSALIDLISKKVPINQLGLGTFSHLLGQLEIRLIRNYFPTVHAQETTGSNSQAHIFSGDSTVLNNLAGNSQQTQFDQSGTPISSQIFGPNGEFLSQAAFLDSGTTVIDTIQDGIAVQIAKTAAGPVIMAFKNQDGSVIAIKSWPNPRSYNLNQPPTSVTLPGQDNTFLTLNIQPNGGGIMNTIDSNGNILKQNQIIKNTYFSSYDTATKTRTETAYNADYTSLNLPNSLGGETAYYFFKNEIISITQTDSSGNTWIANPKGGYNSWEMITRQNNQEVRTTVADPVKALNSNTPSPLDLINHWNHYLISPQAQNTTPEMDFATAFNSSHAILRDQITKADQAYKIEQVPPPSNVLGVIKEAYAANWTPISSEPSIGETKFSGPNGSEAVMSVQGAYGPTPGHPTGTADIKVDIYSGGNVTSLTFNGDVSTFNSLGVSPGAAGTSQPGSASNTALDSVLDAAARGSLNVTNNSTGETGAQVVSSIPGGTPTQQAPPAAPAAPAPAAPAAPAAPGGAALPGSITNLGNLNQRQQEALNGTTQNPQGAAVKAGEAGSAAAAAYQAGSREAALASAEAVKESYISNLSTTGLFSPNEIATIAAYGYVQSYVSALAPGVDWNSAQAASLKAEAIAALGSPAGLSPNSIPAPGPVTPEGSRPAAPAAPPAPPPAAAPAAAPAAGAQQQTQTPAGYPKPNETLAGTYNGFNTSTVYDPVSGGYDTTITNPQTGAKVADFQDQKPGTASGTWNDSTRGYSFNITNGAISSITDEAGNVWSIDAKTGDLTTTRGDGTVTAQDRGWYNAMLNERSTVLDSQQDDLFGGPSINDPNITYSDNFNSNSYENLDRTADGNVAPDQPDFSNNWSDNGWNEGSYGGSVAEGTDTGKAASGFGDNTSGFQDNAPGGSESAPESAPADSGPSDSGPSQDAGSGVNDSSDGGGNESNDSE